MELLVNGKKIETLQSSTLKEFIIQLKLNPDTVIVEKNGCIEKDYSVLLSPGDKLEIIQMVGGG